MAMVSVNAFIGGSNSILLPCNNHALVTTSVMPLAVGALGMSKSVRGGSFRGDGLKRLGDPGMSRFKGKRWASPVCAASVSMTAANRTADEAVDELLKFVAETDGGAAMGPSDRAQALKLVEELEAVGMEEPLKSPLIFGEWEVVYTSNPTAAGGGYRSQIGRALLKTTEMVQTIAEPNSAGNRVVFKAFGAIPGKVTLAGSFQALDNKWVKVDFEAPNFTLASFSFGYAKTSTVKISVSYLDERLRIGRGQYGSIFVFKRR